VRSSPSAIDLLALLNGLLKSNILTWVEVIAELKDPNAPVALANNLKTHFHSGLSKIPSSSEKKQTLTKNWATGLINIVARFASALATSPSFIYSLIPPIYPKESTVFKIMDTRRGLSLSGLSDAHWNDRLLCANFNLGQTSGECRGKSSSQSVSLKEQWHCTMQLQIKNRDYSLMTSWP
jgi:hypothetical protein